MPAPAVCAILEQTGLPHCRGEVEQELLTPTGAAILAGIVDEFLENEEFERAWNEELGQTSDEGTATAGNGAGSPESPVCVGRGTGKRDTGLPPLTMMVCE